MGVVWGLRLARESHDHLPGIASAPGMAAVTQIRHLDRLQRLARPSPQAHSAGRARQPAPAWPRMRTRRAPSLALWQVRGQRAARGATSVGSAAQGARATHMRAPRPRGVRAACQKLADDAARCKDVTLKSDRRPLTHTPALSAADSRPPTPPCAVLPPARAPPEGAATPVPLASASRPTTPPAGSRSGSPARAPQLKQATGSPPPAAAAAAALPLDAAPLRRAGGCPFPMAASWRSPTHLLGPGR
jgi:hypothetical protein